MEMKRKKKKGRPSLSDLSKREINKSSVIRRSSRRNPNSNSNSPPPEFDDDEDERKEKKVKLVVRLPQSNNNQQHLDNSSSNSDSDSEPEEREASVINTSKISSVDLRSNDVVSDQVLNFRLKFKLSYLMYFYFGKKKKLEGFYF